MLKSLLARRRGIGLIEIIVATTLASLVTIAVLQLMRAGFRSSNNMVTSTAASAQRRTLSDFLASRLPSATLPLREAYSLDDSSKENAIDKLVFKVLWDGKPEYWTVWVDCDGAGRVTGEARPTIRTDARDRAYSTSYPPSYMDPPPPPSGGNPIVRARDCEESAFTYLDAQGRAITNVADRLNNTRMLQVKIRPPDNARASDYTLNIPVGINSAPTELSAIPNGDFETGSFPAGGDETVGEGGFSETGTPYVFAEWEAAPGTQVRAASSDDAGISGEGLGTSALRAARILRTGSTGTAGLTSASFTSYGDPITVRVRADDTSASDAEVDQALNQCRVQVLTAGDTPTILRNIPAAPTDDGAAAVGGWHTVTVVMSGDAGQERIIRLANTGPGGCSFDQVQSNG